MPADSVRFGIDLGGTKIELIALRGTQVCIQRRVATPSHDYNAVLESVAQLVESAEAELGARASVGVGMPGALSRKTHTIKNSNTLCLNGRTFDRDLSERLGRPIRVQNDANCFALSEAIDGAGAGAEVVFGVILGTGVGGGIVVRQEALIGCNAIAGEWGHNRLPWPAREDEPAPSCYCGRSGCIETYLSGPGLTRDYVQLGGEAVPAVQIAQRAAASEALASRTLDRYYERLARALASVINVLDPDVIVLGGGLSQIDTLYTRVPQLWSAYIFSDHVATALRPARHGDSSGVRGAAWLWAD
ncbi:MAG TPA: ROK family protein [Polyangiales bacterium]|nr:ROK family protein [Polyangiales bacterium]